MKKLMEWAKAHPWTVGIAVLLLLWAFSSLGTGKRSSTFSLTRDLSTGSSAPGFLGAPSFDGDDMGVVEENIALKAASSFIPGPEPLPPSEPTAGESAAEVEQRIIKTGTMRVVVEDITEAVGELTSQAETVGGFVESSSVIEDRNGKRTGHAVLRIPVERFEETVAKIRSLADLVREETIEGQDVTERYSDLAAQLRNAAAQEEAYLAILRRAVSVEDILNVQRELGNIRSQIEVLTGRLKYLENRTALSTVRVTLEKDVDVQIPTTRFKPLTAAKQALQALVAVFQGVIVTLIWTLIVGFGLGLPAALIIWIVYRVIRRLFSKRKR